MRDRCICRSRSSLHAMLQGYHSLHAEQHLRAGHGEAGPEGPGAFLAHLPPSRQDAGDGLQRLRQLGADVLVLQPNTEDQCCGGTVVVLMSI